LILTCDCEFVLHNGLDIELYDLRTCVHLICCYYYYYYYYYTLFTKTSFLH